MVLAGFSPASVYANNYDYYNKNSVTSYLISNAASTNYWTLSPFALDSSAESWVASSIGFLTFDYYVNNSVGLRPSIALKSNTTISGGNGTAANPFVVN